MATETILSPGVLLQETDKSFITPGVDPSGMAIIGPTAKGPINIPTEVKNYSDFKEIFGTTIRNGNRREEYFTNLAVKNYFENGGASALVTRVASGSWTSATSTTINALEGANDNPFTLVTLGQGTNLNNSADAATAPPEFDNGAYKTGSKDNVKWEIKDINNAQGTFTLIIRRGDDTPSNPIVLESFTECSLDPLSENYISKKVGDISSTAETSSLSGEYIISTTGEFINKSKYVRVSAVSKPTYRYITNEGKVGAGSTYSYSGSLPTAQSGGFHGATGDLLSTTADDNRFGSASGTGLTDIQGLSTGSYDIAISLLKSKDEFKFKTLVIPGLNQDTHASTIDTVIENTTARGDSFFITDLEVWGASVTDVTDESSDIDSSFTAAYYPWVQVFSSELNKNVWCPPSTIIPGVYAKNDSLAAPWFAPAGETRGKLGRLVKGVEKKLSKGNRDTLYSNKINPIASFPDTGLIVFGQKTLQNAKSALDRVNVRRMLLDVKDTIGGFADDILFENNTEQTRDRFIRRATPYLESLVQRQGLYAFQIKMDGQNNTPDVIDENKLVGQVFLQPTKTAEFIVIDFTLTRTGASFTD
jgi:hypothetical protein